MRFLVDECCPREVATALRRAGHDVVSVMERSPGLVDAGVAALADTEDRVLITEDFDFGELAVRHLSPRTGVVILYCPGLEPSGRGERVVDIVGSLADGLLRHITVIGLEGLRRRAY